MSQWLKIITNNGWRIFPLSISSSYLQNVSTGRTAPIIADRVMIDLPGMIMEDRAYQFIDLEGLQIEIPVTDFFTFHKMLSASHEEILPGGSSVFKLRGYITGLVLTLELRNLLLQKMGEILPTLKLLAQKENEEFVRRLKNANKNSPVKFISARAEILERQKDEDKDKPN